MTSKLADSAISTFFSRKSTISAVAVRDYCPSIVSFFSFRILTQQNRRYSAKPRFDFGSIRYPNDAIALFDEIMKIRPQPSVVDFTKLLIVVVKMKQYSSALVLFDKMLQRIAPVYHNTLAIALFHEMVRTPPSVAEFTKLLSSVVKLKEYSLALYMFDEMLQLNAPVNHYTFGIAIDCFCRLKRVDFGFAILGSQIKRGYETDVITFTNLIKGLFLVGKVFEAGMLYDKLLREKLCEPDEVTYLIVMNGLCKAGHTLRALDLLRLLEKERFKPNVHAYNTVIDSLCKDGMVDEALQLLSTLVGKGISPDVFT